ncbi:similar to Saccharomyces cerevisiae YCR093W CDC39 Component of the CCR4-NOT complex [Maudiozyma barnettii]|uniref:Similar to Saccharomyces cerevisiae YCR093W CDC39 Component of the CCR4-NOT complex n=1 Tax=Maudiozyma barnettii TaxID=61262 RepID=A0A8H2ZHP2_9SACH|nr:CCR4-NOT core subunit CDC39 [Kazachstania barnettii]CAB4252324.1 similar to Saccharomyces cerevisiae YCR093W CDC39 Component of the CCR4-NOT complex [Kazachstania barnettii]CAD1779058.1 similar to Saccharomyces cerevisiae YCR093W CDC39 Component of the CCR4-NOT complex [Kazachstania barnettii]
MQSGNILKAITKESNEGTEATNIVISQISLLISTLTEGNFSEIETRINYILSKSSIRVYLRYWDRLLAYAESYILKNRKLDIQGNLQHKLLLNLIKSLNTKNQGFLEYLRTNLFDLLLTEHLTFKDIIGVLDSTADKEIIEALLPESTIQNLKELEELKMNNIKYLQTFVSTESIDSMESKLDDIFSSLNGESLNDIVALLLSEILSPYSQNIQDDNKPSWLTPETMLESSVVGEHISKCIQKVAPNAINWNRIFNLMSTKYFMTTPIKPRTSSFNSLLTSLKHGVLIDQFFSCEWPIDFKLFITCELHKWPKGDGAFDLLNVPDTKKVSDKLPNTKQSLLYILSVATIDLELFFLRDELENKTMLTYYQECFFEDFSYSPEYLYLTLVDNIKHFILLTDNKAVIEEIIITLFVQVFVKTPEVMGDLLTILPSKDKMLTDITRMILQKNEVPIDSFVKLLIDHDKLEYILNRITLVEAFSILPYPIKYGWKGFKTFLKSHINVDTASVALDSMELQLSMTDVNTPLRSSKSFDLPSLNDLILCIMDVPLNNEDLEKFEGLQYKILIAFPKIINISTGHDVAILANGSFTPIAPDVEKEMQGYLQKMYSGDIQIKDVVEVLRKLKDSDEPRDQEVFACITHAVLGECNFFKDYPLEALATTSVLFGSMILFHLLNGFVLDVALRTILNFAKEGSESKMFKFAIQAIYAFRIRLADFPQYCKDLLEQIPGLSTQTQVYQFIYDASQSAQASNQKSEMSSKAASELLPMKYLVVEEWHSSVIQENPTKDITEKVLFIANNITIDNFDSKINEIVTLVTPNYYTWFSNYLVNQRAKTEPNYHTLYCKIFTAFKSNPLHECVINITLRQLYVILAIKDKNQIDKKTMKNLSSWLGLITLGVDRPIRHRNVAFRELLLEAYKEDRLDIIVPFVTKVLQNVESSKVFRPPNPWTIGILQILLELNEKANWKLSLTFEVEVLFKTLNISMKGIQPSNLIEAVDSVDIIAGKLGNISLEQQQGERQKQIMLMQQHQQHMLMYRQRQQQMLSSGITEQNQFNVESLGSASAVPNIPSQQVSGMTTVQSNETPFQNLLGSTVFVTHPDLKRVFQMALAKSVREILIPAVEKASNIAVVSTIKIVGKDFATEVDEGKLNTAAINMVRHLAQSLSRATSIEPLRETIRTTTQSLAPNLANLSFNPFGELDNAINDNIGLALVLIENAAVERSVQEISEQLVQSIAVRRYHRERRADQPFLAPNVNPYSLTLPEPLGLKSSGVTQQQLNIYKDFGKFMPNGDGMVGGKISAPPIMNQNSAVQVHEQFPQVPQQQQQQRLAPQPPMVQPVQQMNTIQNELEQNHRVLVHLMDVLVAQIKENSSKESLEELGENNQINNIIFQILTFIARSEQKDQLALKVAQAVVNSLFATSESSLCREVLSLLLEKLCSLSLVARKDVSWWLIYALDSRKFDVRVIRSLLEVHLINVSELDNVMVTAMINNMENAIEFAIDVLKGTVLSKEPILMRMDFVRTLEHLSRVDDPKVKEFLNQFNSSDVLPITDGTNVILNEKYFLVFTEWVKLLQRVDIEDDVVLAFISQMMENGVITDSDSLIRFLKSALELSVFAFKESDPTSEVFTAIDGLSKLIIKLLVYQEFTEWTKSAYMHVIFSVMLLVCSKDHEDPSFNERPYFRFLSNLLFEWSTLRGNNFASIENVETRKEYRNFDIEFYNIFATYLHSFQPFAFPGFTFAWVSLISHRMFLPIMLRLDEKKGWKKLMILLIDLFKFLDTYTKKTALSDTVSVVYKGTLRVILGISNDLPDFLIENHFELMNNIPATYFQLKNVILSTIPLKMVIPNPYDSTLSMENMEVCQTPPCVFYDPVEALQSLKKPIDNYLRIPSNSLFKTISNGLYRTEYDIKNGVGFDFVSVDQELVRAIVLHVGIEAGLENGRTSSSAVFNTKSSYYALLFNMINEGISELKYQILQVMIEQLRFPNIHTYWFSYVLVNMFTSKDFGDNLAEVQEIMLRVLLERIIVNRPHAWGVSVLVTKLLTNEEIDIMDLPFMKAVPQIETIFQQLKKHTAINITPYTNTEVPDGNNASIAAK